MKNKLTVWGEVVKTTISIIAVALIGLHIWKPNLKVDAVTIALLVLAVLPWLYSVIESAKLPGGYEIKFRELADAGQKIGSAADIATLQASVSIDAESPQTTLERVQLIDPNLALAGLRIEIEKSVRKIAEVHGLANRGSLTQLVGNLGSNGILPATMVDGLKSLVRIGNDAVHGASVDPDAAEWAILHSHQIIASLNRLGGATD